MEDGEQAATEITACRKMHMGTPTPTLLDWGCGTGRIARHLPTLLPDALLYACDTNESIIEWNKKHYPQTSCWYLWLYAQRLRIDQVLLQGICCQTSQ